VAETDGQVERLEQVFSSIDETPKGKTCDAIMGIIEEGKEIMDEYKGMPALDAGLLAAAQAVEHYEISRYGTLKTWAKILTLSAVGREIRRSSISSGFARDGETCPLAVEIFSPPS
jgi:ferritin-like metal-binding protein YciE